MALLTELTDAVAKVEGLPETFVAGVARYLREAEHIRQGGRGLSAAKMLPRDAAALLIGVNATRLAKDAVEAFEVYAGLKWLSLSDDCPDDVRLNLIRASLLGGISLVEAISRLIKLATGDGDAEPPLLTLFSKAAFRLDIRFSRPRNIVQIDIIDQSSTGRGVVFRGVFHSEDEEEPSVDRRDVVTITQKTILEVGRVLAS